MKTTVLDDLDDAMLDNFETAGPPEILGSASVIENKCFRTKCFQSLLASEETPLEGVHPY